MTTEAPTITADAVALQGRDEFRAAGWLKVVSPAKVNLHLAIGGRREDGYHDATTIMHALNLHDVVYLRAKRGDAQEGAMPSVRMVPCGDVVAPLVADEQNLAVKAVMELARRLDRADAGVELRIEKNIPAEGGLGGGSSNAAAALVGAAALWGVPADAAEIEESAKALGSDVAFFLHGGCSAYGGAGEQFIRDLVPSKRAVALVKPAVGVSTAEAYRTFDLSPLPVSDEARANAACAQHADEVVLFNNLAAASELLEPELAEVRGWLETRPEVQGCLLCGSGATTFALCDDFASACAVVAEARQRGYWARTTSLGSLRAMCVSV